MNNPITLNKRTVKNRIFKPAMSEQLADKHGNPKADLLSKLYETWGKGGAGLLITGNIMVDRNALGEPSNVVLDDLSDLSKFKTWVNAVKPTGSLIFAQLNHPGKQVPRFLNAQPMAPSAIPIAGPLASGFKPPREMTEDDIKRVIQQFATTSKLAKEVGFDGIEIHGAHGYLINQFLSPKHNKRQDKWGNGLLFITEVYNSIRKAVGQDYPILIKLNSSDFEKGGYSETDALKAMKLMEAIGMDGIEISGGTYESQSMTGEGQSGSYFLNFARGASKALNIPVLLTGGFQSKSQIEIALADGIDMVGVGRPMVLNPNFANAVINGSTKTYPNDINRSKWQYLNLVSMLSWWEVQMLKIAKGKVPNPNLSVYNAALHAVTHVGLKSFAPRRG
ncbi:MAG: NADH:flavin oxidoreductase/NADH oxidase family protein [Flavobacteriaceae bacterium]